MDSVQEGNPQTLSLGALELTVIEPSWLSSVAPSSECPEEGCVICEVLSKVKLQVAINFSAGFYRSAVR